MQQMHGNVSMGQPVRTALLIRDHMMIDDTDQTEAIYLVARHGRDAPQIAGTRYALAAGRGDTGEARRWRSIRRFLRKHIGR
jgi:hypothetical protein